MILRLAAATLLALALFTATPAPAAEAQRSIMERPAELDGKIAASTPYGSGSLRKFFMHLYDSSLWTDEKTWSADKKYALLIRYAIHLSLEELTERSINEMERSGKLTDAEKAAYRHDFNTYFRAINPGDVLTALYDPEGGCYFYLNGQKMGGAVDPARAKRLMMIWLGPDTSEPEMRQKLLALK